MFQELLSRLNCAEAKIAEQSQQIRLMEEGSTSSNIIAKGKSIFLLLQKL